MISFRIRSFFAFALVLGLCAPALAAEDNNPVNIRAVGGSVMGGTWNVAFTALAKLLKEKYPGSNVNVLLGANVSNPLKLETNGGDLSATQSYIISQGLKGQAPFKKQLKDVTSVANVNDVTVIHFLANKNLDADSLEEIIAKKLPVRIDPGSKAMLSNPLGEKVLKALGASYADIEKWGGKVTPVAGADRPGMMQDGTINVVFMLGSKEQPQIQEMITNTGIKWLKVNPDVLKQIADESGIQVSEIPAGHYNGAVTDAVPVLADTVHVIARKGMSDEDVYKITKTLAEGHDYIGDIQPMWKSLKPETMAKGLIAPLHPGAERYYRESGLLK